MPRIKRLFREKDGSGAKAQEEAPKEAGGKGSGPKDLFAHGTLPVPRIIHTNQYKAEARANTAMLARRHPRTLLCAFCSHVYVHRCGYSLDHNAGRSLSPQHMVDISGPYTCKD